MTLNVIIPMAGLGQRFADAGYEQPKPLIDVAGAPMIERVMECLTPDGGAHFCLLTSTFIEPASDRSVVFIGSPTQGAVDTLLRGEQVTGPGPVVVANVDQWLAAGVIDKFLDASIGWDAAILTFDSTNPHHSYARLDGDRVTAVVEKQVISGDALVGVYWFADSLILFDYARKVIANNLRFGNGEFYLSSILDLMVKDDLRMRAVEIAPSEKAMLGTPEELRIFEDKVRASRIIL